MASSKPIKQPSYNIVMIGKTGHGKSSTGNTILNRKIFDTFLRTTSGTVDCKLESSRFGNVILNVIDTPGLMDTSKNTEEVCKKLDEVMSLCPGGFHAFIFVLQSTAKFTKEEIETLSHITHIFGPSFIKVCIIALTHGDSFDMNDEAIPFDDWLKQQTGEVAKLIKDCEYRCLLFYNSTRYPLYEQKRQETVSKLVQLIQKQRMLYTDEHFKKAEKGRLKMIIKCRLPQLDAKYQQQLSLIAGEIENCSKMLEETSSIEIHAIEEEINNLLAIIEEDDKGTDVLQEFKTRVNQLLELLNNIRSSKKKSEKLKKMAEYTRLLKNPPSKLRIVVPVLKVAAAVVGGVIGTAVTAFIPPVAVAVAGAAATGVVANAIETGCKVRDIITYNNTIQTLEDEIKEIE